MKKYNFTILYSTVYFLQKVVITILLCFLFSLLFFSNKSYAQVEDGPNHSLLTISSNALNLQKGQGVYRNIMAFYNDVEYGVTNNLSIRAIMAPYGALGMGFGAKLSTNSTSKFNVGVLGRVGGAFLFLSSLETPGLLLSGGVSFTYGDYKSNFGVDMSITFADRRNEFLTLGSMYSTIQLSKKNYLTMEGMILYQFNIESPVQVFNLLAQLNHVGKKVTFSGGLSTFLTPNGFFDKIMIVPFPILSIRVPFGKKKVAMK